MDHVQTGLNVDDRKTCWCYTNYKLVFKEMKLVLKEMKQKIDTFRYNYCILNMNKEQFSAESPWHDVDADTSRLRTKNYESSLFISHYLGREPKAVKVLSLLATAPAENKEL